PNPAKDVATVKYELTSSNASLEVYDLLGKSLFKQNLSVAKGEVRLNTSTYTSGVYIVVIRQEDGHVLQKKLVID
ncbi:MAG TPA: T9SS type A sorting domain-containing protein, partial [Brumimicrobium sp.]|nr:T9SS type A sorting domain-containing protein [Brumimicrobium sp.]